MTARNDTRTDRQTLTEFISGFGIEYRWLYADESGSTARRAGLRLGRLLGAGILCGVGYVSLP